MGSEVCADEQVICGSWSFTCNVGDEEAKNVAGPATPEENAEHGHPSSPPPSSPNVETPKETLFDSFAPGSDKLLLAPRHRKYREESRSHVVRRLNFTSLIKDFNNVEDDTSTDEEERLFEIVYGTIMDAISAELAAAGEGTPRSTPLLTGIAETCPAAPSKPGTRHRCIIDKEICKKLEF